MWQWMMACGFFVSVSVSAQAQQSDIPPALTNKDIQQIKGVHQAFWNVEKPQGSHLLVSFGGTNSIPSDFSAFNSLAADLGYDVLAIDYDNSIITTTCKESADPKCFDHFRQEIVTGKSVSSLIEVNTINSLEKRIEHLLKHLQTKDVKRWGAYLKNGKVQWQKIVAVGHSQGSGHAAYLGKIHVLQGVILLAGPQDRFANGQKVGWLKLPSQTRPDRYFAFLHREDFFGSDYQVSNMMILRNSQKASPNIVITTEKVRDPHMSVILPQFKEAWKSLLLQAKAP